MTAEVPEIIPLQLIIGPYTNDGRCPLRAVAPGREGVATLELPQHLRTAAERLLEPEATLPIGDAAALGRTLGKALFPPPIRNLLLQIGREAAEAGGRVQLQLRIAEPDLGTLPWEWATLGETKPWSPAVRDDYALVRVSRRMPTLEPVTVPGPLHILAIASSDEQTQLTELQTALARAQRAGHVRLRMIPKCTPDLLARALAEATPYHILHIAAPILLDQDQHVVLELDEDIEEVALAELIQDHPTLRLVLLAGAEGDGKRVGAAPALLGAMLLNPTLPAAVILNGALPADISAYFAAVLYGNLAVGEPLDIAVTSARKALAEDEEGRWWGLPQVRMAPGCEELFAVTRAATKRPTVRQFWPIIAAVALLAIVTLLFVVLR